MKKLLVAINISLLCFTLLFSGHSFAQKQTQSFYQITIYHYKDSAQQNTISQYLEKALLPSLHRINIKNVGVFTALANDTSSDKMMYVLLPLKSLGEVADVASKLSLDKMYNASGTSYLNAPYDTAPYTRMETILLQAFPLAPTITQSGLTVAKKERVYELRSYEGATEKIHATKVKMFNAGDEVGIFKRLDFNAVFYGEVIAGSRMPNLMYMTTFANMDERNAHWKKFGDDAAFKKLLAMPEYQHNVSKSDIIFLRPADYSDL